MQVHQPSVQAGTLVSISLRDAYMRYYSCVLCSDWPYAAVVIAIDTRVPAQMADEPA